jgi:chromosome segregation ATPase
MSGQPSTDEFRQLYEAVQQLQGRIETLETDRDQLRTRVDEYEAAFEAVSANTATLDDLETDLRDLTATVETTRDETDDTHEALRDDVDDIFDTLTVVSNRLGETNRRVSALESYVERTADDSENEVQAGLDDPAMYAESELGYLARLPDHIRDVEIENVQTRRALEVFESFDKWSKRTRKGYIITSGELQRYMSGDFKINQVHRVMDEFNKKTSSEYTMLRTPNGPNGRKVRTLIKWHPKYRPD